LPRLLTALVAVPAGESRDITVWLSAEATAGSGVITLTATSESAPSATATARVEVGR
jgi:uncharacterized membrane protein